MPATALAASSRALSGACACVRAYGLRLVLFTWQEVIEWAVVPDAGRWLRIRSSQTVLVLELFLAGFAVDYPVALSNDPPPEYECDTCVPEFQSADEPVVKFKRRIEYAEAGLSPALAAIAAQQCAEIVPGHDPMTVITGNILSVRQQPPTSACPFDLFVWVPKNPAPGVYVATEAEPFSHEADMLSAMGASSAVVGTNVGCGNEFGLLAGSTAQDGVKGLILRQVQCEGILQSPSPPSQPPLPPSPSPSPPPHVLLDINDGEPPPAFELHVLSDTRYVVSMHGNHILHEGDVVRLMPLTNGDCTGAAAADVSVHGGALTSSLTTVLTLSGGVDGTDSAIYALCLADEPIYHPLTDPLTDDAFEWLPHVRVIVSHEPPAAPPPPSPPPPLPPAPPSPPTVANTATRYSSGPPRPSATTTSTTTALVSVAIAAAAVRLYASPCPKLPLTGGCRRWQLHPWRMHRPPLPRVQPAGHFGRWLLLAGHRGLHGLNGGQLQSARHRQRWQLQVCRVHGTYGSQLCTAGDAARHLHASAAGVHGLESNKLLARSTGG